MKEMKDLIKKHNELYKQRREVENSMGELFEKEFNCKISVGASLTTVKNDFYRFSVWFFTRAEAIEDAGCLEMPETEKEVLDIFNARSQQNKEIRDCRNYLTSLFEDMAEE